MGFRGYFKVKNQIVPNRIMVEGATRLFNSGIFNVLGPITMYAGLIDASNFQEITGEDTLLNHSGWSEFTNYTGDRKKLNYTASPENGELKMEECDFVKFTMTSSGLIKGLLIATSLTGNLGQLWSAAEFECVQSVQENQVISVGYDIIFEQTTNSLLPKIQP